MNNKRLKYLQDSYELIKSIPCRSKRLTKYQKIIISTTANVYGLKTRHVFIRRRINPLPEIRFICAIHLREKMILEDIAKLLNLKTHASVLHCIKTFKSFYDTDKYFKNKADMIEILIEEKLR